LTAIDSIWDNLVSKNYIYRVVQEQFLQANGMEIIMNYQMQQPTTKPVQLLPMYTGTSACFKLHGESKYIDVLEKILYNGLISGVGMDGKSFFYTNAMQVKNNFHHHSLEPRKIWLV
jgi:DUF1680 family protein